MQSRQPAVKREGEDRDEEHVVRREESGDSRRRVADADLLRRHRGEKRDAAEDTGDDGGNGE